MNENLWHLSEGGRLKEGANNHAKTVVLFTTVVEGCLDDACLFAHRAMISFTRDKWLPDWQGYFYASLMFIIALVQSLLLHQYFMHCISAGMNVRTALVASIYRKVMLSIAKTI